MVADTFEAITADRPYRVAAPPEVALAELRRHAGTQFDPDCVAALARVLEDERYAATSTGGSAAAASPASHALRPAGL